MPIGKTIDMKRLFDKYSDELNSVEGHLLSMFQSNAPIIQLIGKHLVSGGGKRIRPLFLLASARLCGYRGKEHLLMASIIETVHTASLLHDDVVDGAATRRGRPSANSVWGNQIVILVGDYLYSNALRYTASLDSQAYIRTLSDATTRMTQGEVLQLTKTGDLGISTEDYYRIIGSKTGALISASCKMAAILSGQPKDRQDALGGYGYNAGIVFQMADDILDYSADEASLGKKLGKDFEEGKVTLPLINLLKKANASEVMEIRTMFEDGFGDSGLGRLIGLFGHYNVIDESLCEARGVVKSAVSELDLFPPSQERDDLIELAEYALIRNK